MPKRFLVLVLVLVLGLASVIFAIRVLPDLSRGTGAVVVVKNLDNDGLGSLRWAIRETPNGSTIHFDVTGIINLTSSLSLDRDLAIIGPGPSPKALIIRRASGSSPVLTIAPGTRVTLRQLTFMDGQAGSGGAIANWMGFLVISNSTFQNNQAAGGGAISNDRGVLTIISSTFQNNQATLGGAISNDNGVLTIANSTFQSNHATGGGAIATQGGQLSISGCTFQANQATGGGGVENVQATVLITNSTFQGNQGGAGAIENLSGKVVVTNSTFADNSNHAGSTITNLNLLQSRLGRPAGIVQLTNTIIDARSGNRRACEGSITDGGSNLQYPFSDCGTSIPVADPKLQPLADNGGPTMTMALAPDSPAIRAGDRGTCMSQSIGNIDQRGFQRIENPGDATSPACDIGAFQHGRQ